jgi:NTP pyrophosphatase (non-canonical NTP hydrolase)
MNINNLIELSHSTAKEKGFWDSEERNKPELLMLIVSELAEALEALRKEHKSNPDIVTSLYNSYLEEPYPMDAETFKTEFQNHVKNSFEDEIADTVIRLFDLCGGLGIDLETHILLKINYNKLRGYKHGKTF